MFQLWAHCQVLALDEDRSAETMHFGAALSHRILIIEVHI